MIIYIVYDSDHVSILLTEKLYAKDVIASISKSP